MEVSTMPTPNFKFYVNVWAFLPYSYVCEHCGEPSGVQEYGITGRSNGIMDIYSADEGEASARAYVDAELPYKLKQLKRQLKRGQCPFDPRCPHCHKLQSWSTWKSFTEAAERTLRFDALLVLFAILLHLFVPSSDSVFLAGAACVSCVILTAASLGPSWLRFRKSALRHMPEADWDNIRYSSSIKPM